MGNVDTVYGVIGAAHNAVNDRHQGGGNLSGMTAINQR
jgi:hypothetical protein